MTLDWRRGKCGVLWIPNDGECAQGDLAEVEKDLEVRKEVIEQRN